jgi:hypothetical protein
MPLANSTAVVRSIIKTSIPSLTFLARITVAAGRGTTGAVFVVIKENV